MTRGVLASIRNLIKRSLVTKSVNDANDFQVMQVSYLGKTADIENILPYGLCSSPPVNSLSIMLNVNAHEENRVGITNSPRIRFKNLLEGEVAVGNYLTGSVVKFLADGNIEVTSANDLVVTVAGNATVNVTGATTVTSTGNVTVEAPLTTIDGDLTVTGDTALGATVTSDGTNIGDDHVHINVTAGTADTGVPKP